MPEFDTAVGILHYILLQRQVKVLMRGDSITIAGHGSMDTNPQNEYVKQILQEDKNKKLINHYFNQLSQEEQLFLEEFVKKLGLPEDYLPRDTRSIINEEKISDDQKGVKTSLLRSIATRLDEMKTTTPQQPKTSFFSIGLCCDTTRA